MEIPGTLRSRKTLVSVLIKPYRPYGPARPDKKRPSRQVLVSKRFCYKPRADGKMDNPDNIDEVEEKGGRPVYLRAEQVSKADSNFSNLLQNQEEQL